MTKPAAHTQDSFLRDTGEKAAALGLRALRLTDAGGRDQGLCLLREELSAGDLLKLLAAPEAIASGPPADASLPPHPEPLARLFAVEAERVRRTRTPCALLLAGIDGSTEAPPGAALTGAVIKVLQQYAEPIDAVGQLTAGLLGLVMPGANFGRAERRAAAIRKAVRESGLHDGAGLPLTVSIAIAVRSAVTAETDETFLRQVRSRLTAAMTQARDQEIHIRPPREQDSCQVTLEERAQLLGELFS